MKILKDSLKTIALSLIVLFLVGAAYAGPEPIDTPPNPAGGLIPLNTGPIFQNRAGDLWVNSLGLTNGLIVTGGDVGIGTTNPGARLEVQAPTGITEAFNTAFRGRSNDGAKHIDLNIQNDGKANFGGNFTNFGIGTTDPQATLDVNGNLKVRGSFIDNNWKLLASGSDWTEEAIITLKASGATFETDYAWADQSVNLGTFNWPSSAINEISFKPSNQSDGYCIGGAFATDLRSLGLGRYPYCQDLRYQGTTLTRHPRNEDDAIRIVINGVPMDYCPDQYGRKSNDPAYPGTQGFFGYFSPVCYYRAGTDYASSDVAEIRVEEIDWTPEYGGWEWEIWYR